MNEQPKRQKRWLKEHHFPFIFPVLVLGAFVLWGLWPMLAPRWDQDQCSFGEVTNERYWQMREEVREDVKNTLSEIRASYRMPISEYIKSRNFDLNEIEDWFQKNTVERIEASRPELLAKYVRRVLLSKLLQKHIQNVSGNNEKIAYAHAILREMGGWFRFSQKSPQMTSALFIYYSHSGPIQNSIEAWVKSLFKRYAGIWIRYSINTDNGKFYLSRIDLGIERIEIKNLGDYFKLKTSSGCPNPSTFTN